MDVLLLQWTYVNMNDARDNDASESYSADTVHVRFDGCFFAIGATQAASIPKIKQIM
jgi:hypothetical protein